MAKLRHGNSNVGHEIFRRFDYYSMVKNSNCTSNLFADFFKDCKTKQFGKKVEILPNIHLIRKFDIENGKQKFYRLLIYKKFITSTVYDQNFLYKNSIIFLDNKCLDIEYFIFDGVSISAVGTLYDTKNIFANQYEISLKNQNYTMLLESTVKLCFKISNERITIPPNQKERF